MRVVRVRNILRFPRSYEEGLDFGHYWGGKVYLLGAPTLVMVVAVRAHQRPYDVGSWLGMLVGLATTLLVGRLVFLFRELRQLSGHGKGCSHEPMVPCTAACLCGCGRTLDESPMARCGKDCACGCARPCTIHVDHRGGCAGT